jgi:protein involved in polysaccharide export with SLBB domain
VREEQQKGLDQMIQNLEQDITRNALTPTAGNPDDANEKRSELDAQRQLVDKLRRAKATGRIVLEMRPDSAGVDNLPDIALEDGDRLLVPYRPSSVAVLGAVYNKNSFLYRTDNRVGKYLQAAGGATRDADKGRIFVIRADGSVVSKQSVSGLWTGNFEGLRLAPGDSIIVPERLNRGATLRGIRDWTQIFSNFALGAAAVTVLK